MAVDIPADALSVDAVLDWLPERRLSIDYLPVLLNQDVDRIRIDVGTLTGDEDGEWVTTLYITDTEYEVMHVVGWDLEAESWVGIESWVGKDYDPETVEDRVIGWTDENYTDSSFSRTK